MARCGLDMQQCAMHNPTIQKTAFFGLGVYKSDQCTYLSTEQTHSKFYVKHNTCGGIIPNFEII